MKITVLAENTAASCDFIAGHSLSFFIETENNKVLYKSLATHPQLHFVSDYLKINEGIGLFSGNDIQLKYPSQPFGLTAEIDGVRQDDGFRHEQYMLIKESGKNILISSYSHTGISNPTLL